MLRDFRDAPEGCQFETDVCIVGAGAAGIAIAHSLIGMRLQVALIESGGVSYEAATQGLYEGASVGDRWGVELTRTRLRWFGGSTNEWGRGCRPLDGIDFDERSWVPHSGWPISPAQLSSYYEKARTFCGLPSLPFEAHGLLQKLRPQLPALDPTKLNHCFSMLSFEGGFGKAYFQKLQAASNLDVLLHANLVELVPNASGNLIRKALIQTLDGKKGSIRARWFILACGGIENARMLLLSDTVAPNGLGNSYDVVGRYFMDHPNVNCATIKGTSANSIVIPYVRDPSRRRFPICPIIQLSEELQERRKVLNGRFQLIVRDDGGEPQGVQALRSLKQAGLQGASLNNLGRQAFRVAKDLHTVVPAIFRFLCDRPVSPTSKVFLEAFFEQAPNPGSRIRLGQQRDALGLRKVELDWRLTDLDCYTHREGAVQFIRELQRHFSGQIRLADWLQSDSETRAAPRGTAHHMGTTRMSSDPRLGVVDHNCRVYGLDNLYMAGSSVFPTSGWAFPTYTIIALALRLSNHILDRVNSDMTILPSSVMKTDAVAPSRGAL